jgi:uncharacterized protein (UPF0332 family)
MDEATKQAYIRVRLDKARSDLSNARNDLEHGFFRGAANRAYYAVFHTASAALLWLDVERARHSGVQSAFGERLIKSGIIEPEYSTLFVEARKIREEQDYDLEAAPLTLQDAAQIVDDAERFVNRIEQYLRQVGAT